MSQSAPPQPRAHTHFPIEQRPRGGDSPEPHCVGEAHARAAHEAPVHPAQHAHLPSAPHVPWPLQPSGHDLMPQSAPHQPSSQSHVLSEAHVPWPEQLFAHAGYAQPGPAHR